MNPHASTLVDVLLRSWGKIRERIRLIIFAVIFAIAGAIVVSVVMPAAYEATSIVRISHVDSSSGVASNPFSSQDLVNFDPYLKLAENRSFDQAVSAAVQGSPSSTSETIMRRLLGANISTSVTSLPNTNLLRITARAPSPEEAANAADQAAALLVKEVDKISEAAASAEEGNVIRELSSKQQRLTSLREQLVNLKSKTVISRATIDDVSLIGQVDVDTDVRSIKVQGNQLVAGGHGALVILNIKKRAKPVTRSVTRGLGNINALEVSGDAVYLAAGVNGLAALDISDPSKPRVAKRLVYKAARDLMIAGRTLYVADGDAGVLAYDISEPMNPTFIGLGKIDGGASGVYAANGLIYVTSKSGGLHIFKRTKSGSLPQLGSVQVSGEARDVFVTGSTAYVFSGGQGVVVADVSDAGNPVPVSEYITPSATDGVLPVPPMGGEVQKGRLFLADGNSGLGVLDASNRQALRNNTNFFPGGFFWGLDIDDKYVYVGNLDGGISILNGGKYLTIPAGRINRIDAGSASPAKRLTDIQFEIDQLEGSRQALNQVLSRLSVSALASQGQVQVFSKAEVPGAALNLSLIRNVLTAAVLSLVLSVAYVLWLEFRVDLSDYARRSRSLEPDDPAA